MCVGVAGQRRFFLSLRFHVDKHSNLQYFEEDMHDIRLSVYDSAQQEQWRRRNSWRHWPVPRPSPSQSFFPGDGSQSLDITNGEGSSRAPRPERLPCPFWRNVLSQW